jgi:transposase
VQRALRKAGFDTRTVHPFASSHYRKTLHPDIKTDDNDLEAIFHAAINGYGLALLDVDPVYLSLQGHARHRRNLVKQRARLQVQIRDLMHRSMPGFADLFEDNKLFGKSIAIPVVKQFSSAESIKRAGSQTIAKHLKSQKIRFQMRTIDRIVAWSAIAADPDPLSPMLTGQWKQLAELHAMISTQVEQTEREMAGFLAKTPYVLLLSVTGINVVSAGGLAGEAGPIEHYASATALNGRAGLYPSRYQSDEVDRSSSVAKSCNRRLRAACIMVATNLIKCHPYYRGQAALMKIKKIATVDQRCRIANRSNRMVFQIVSGRQVWRGKGIDRDDLLFKLREFHRTHHSPLEQTVRDMNEAFVWLPKSSYADEAKQLADLAKKKRRGVASIGELLLPLLIRLGVRQESEVESNSSEARSPQ